MRADRGEADNVAVGANTSFDGLAEFQEHAWRVGVKFVEDVVRVPVPEAMDVVVTSCAGYPLDTTWYQAVKGLTGVLSIVKQGGTIILAASLSEGLGSHEFQEMLGTSRYMRKHGAAPDKEAMAAFCEMDEWQLVMFSKVMARCKVKVVSDGLSPETLRRCLVVPASSVEAAVAECLAVYGPNAKIAVIPKGPYVMPCVG